MVLSSPSPSFLSGSIRNLNCLRTKFRHDRGGSRFGERAIPELFITLQENKQRKKDAGGV